MDDTRGTDGSYCERDPVRAVQGRTVKVRSSTLVGCEVSVIVYTAEQEKVDGAAAGEPDCHGAVIRSVLGLHSTVSKM